MQKTKSIILLLVIICQVLNLHAQNDNFKDEFQKIASAKAEVIFSDSFTNDWSNQWMLDVEKAFVKSGDGSLKFLAGPMPQHDDHHAVL